MTDLPAVPANPASETVDVCIVNWNAGALLAQCVDSLILVGGPHLGRIWVIDNGSEDGSPDLVAHKAGVEVVKTGQNLGFGKACNLGAKRCTSRNILFLNPDAALLEGTLTAAVQALTDPANAQVGIFGVALIDESGAVSRSCTRFPGPMALIAHSIGWDRLRPTSGHFMTEWDHGQTRQVDHVIGAFYVVRRALFEQLGGFDERFFVYLEDLDFSYRARQAGWQCLYLADIKAFHLGGGTSRQVKATRLFYALRSQLLYAQKHFSLWGSAAVMVATLIIEPVSRLALALATGSGAAARETLSAYRRLWHWAWRARILGQHSSV